MLSNVPVIRVQTTRINGELEVIRNKDNARLYNCGMRFRTSRRRNEEKKNGAVLMQGAEVEAVYQIP